MRAGINNTRRPIWLPASNFYALAVAFSAAFFFLVWGILHDGGEDAPWLTAAMSTSILFCGAVILREVVLRRAYNRFLIREHAMKTRVDAAGQNSGTNDPLNPNKLTLEKNAVILNDIRQKSDAANVLSKFSAGHREVFELCGEYLELNESELKAINPNSPRLAPLLKSRSAVADYHHYHLLKWAEIEARTLTIDARNKENITERIEAAQNALYVVESALESYPSEPTLLQSKELLGDMIVSIKVSDWVEKAERAEFEQDYASAKSHYRDALFYLGRDNIQSEEREEAASRINIEIERLRLLEIGE